MLLLLSIIFNVIPNLFQGFVLNVHSCSSEDPISHLQGHLTSSVMVGPRWMRGGAPGLGWGGVVGGIYSAEREKKGIIP